MRRTVRELSFLLLIAGLSAPAGFGSTVIPSCAALGSWGARGLTSDAVVVDGKAWVVDGRGLAIYDLASRRLFRQVWREETSSISLAVEKGDDFVAVLTRTDLSIRRPDSVEAEQLDRASLNRQLDLLAVEGSQIVLAGPDRIETWSAEGGELVRLASTATLADPTGLTIRDGIAFLAYPSLGVQAYRASTLERLGRLPTKATHLATNSLLPIVATRENLGFATLDTGENPRFIASARPDHDVVSVALSGHFIYVSDGAAKTTIYTVSGLGEPLEVGRLAAGGLLLDADDGMLVMSRLSADPWGVLGGDAPALEVFDVASPVTARKLGEVGSAQRPVTGVALDWPWAFVSEPPHFSVVDITASQPRAVATLELEGHAPLVRLSGDVAILYGGRWVHLLDVADPQAPRFLGRWETLGVAGGSADIAGRYLVEANNASGFHVVDIGDPTNPFQIGGLINGGRGQWRRVAGAEGVVYGITTSGVAVVDITTPTQPRIVNFFEIGGATEIEMIESRNLLVVLNLDELRFYDTTSPYAPVLISTVKVGVGTDVAVDGNSIWVLLENGSLQEIDISDVSSPGMGSVLAGFDRPRQIAVSAETIGVADTWSLELVFDPTPLPRPGAPPGAPVLLERVPELARLSATGPAGALIEAEIITDEGSRIVRVDSGEILVDEPGAFEVRVRYVLGCATSSWSDILRVAFSPELHFTSRMTRRIVAPGEPASITLAVRNRSSAVITAALSSTSSSIPASGEIRFPGQSTTFVELEIPPFEILGTVDATISLEWDGGTDEHRVRLTRVAAGPVSSAPVTDRVLPGIGSTPGAQGTRWRSDVFLHCGTTTGCMPQLVYDTPSGDRIVELSLRGGETVTLENVAADLFGMDGTVGYLRLAAEEQLLAHGWTFNASDVGRFGQLIWPTKGLTVGIITGGESTTRYRTNLGLVNPTAEAVEVRLEIESGGVPLASHQLVLEPGESSLRDVAGLVPVDGPVSDISLRISASQPVAVYASRIDQTTGDPVMLEARPEGADSPLLIFDPVGATPGARDSLWKTELNVTSLERAGDVVFALVPTVDGSVHAETLFLTEGETYSSDALIDDLFGGLSAEQMASGTLRVSGEPRLSAWARVFNEGPAGTFGQMLRAFGTGDGAIGTLARGEKRSLFPVEETARRRTNLGWSETSGLPVEVIVRVFDSGGVLLHERRFPTEPLRSVRLNRYLEGIGLKGLVDARIELEVEGEGNLAPWISLVENDSGDARYVN